MGLAVQWTMAEDDAIRAHSADLPKLLELLPNRSHRAIKTRVRNLGLSAPRPGTRRVWTGADSKFLRAKTGSRKTLDEIKARYPEVSWAAVRDRAYKFGCPFPRARSERIEHPAIVAIRNAAQRQRITFVELDRRIGGPAYFSKSNKRLFLGPVAKAARLLGGDIVIRWDADT